VAGDIDDRRGIDRELRQRVREESAIVTNALDAAVADPTNENLEELRASTDKLMRALGRILIEIARQQSAS
jgi:hypothetical protein